MRIAIFKSFCGILFAVALLLIPKPALAYSFAEIVMFDENGNGSFYQSPTSSPVPLSYGTGVAPGYAGSPSTLYYELPIGLNTAEYPQGQDVAVIESATNPEVISDFLRLVPVGIGQSRLYVYSDLDGGSDLADVGIPEGSPLASVTETTATNGNRVAAWIAINSTSPGYDYDHGLQVIYSFTSDYAVPEPATLAVWSLLGAIGLVAGRRRFLRTA
jgi:hypothetical protein